VILTPIQAEEEVQYQSGRRGSNNFEPDPYKAEKVGLE
jgi:hypothetical protein